jgi:hypothetical protein
MRVSQFVKFSFPFFKVVNLTVVPKVRFVLSWTPNMMNARSFENNIAAFAHAATERPISPGSQLFNLYSSHSVSFGSRKRRARRAAGSLVRIARFYRPYIRYLPAACGGVEKKQAISIRYDSVVSEAFYGRYINYWRKQTARSSPPEISDGGDAVCDFQRF